MSATVSSMFDDLMPVDSMLTATQEIVDTQLKPLTEKIDLEGYYPKEVIQNLGPLGVFRPHLSSVRSDGETDMGAAIRAMSVVSHECLSTGFANWCQDTCGWYLQNATNDYTAMEFVLIFMRTRTCAPRMWNPQ